jgi:antitoxin ParD1/3/4
MNVLLKPELEQFISEKVKAGQYTDASDIVNEALEMLREQEQFTPEHEAFLRQEVRKGLKQLDEGQRAQFDARKIIAEERSRLA